MSSRRMREHVVAVRLFYDLLGSWPCPWAHETVLGRAAGPEIALQGKEGVTEKEPSEVWSATNEIRNLIFVGDAGYL